MMRLTDTVKHLIIINVILFVATQLPQLQNVMFQNLALYFPENPNFRIWQLISSMFMHSGIMHILFNMLVLASFGSALEYIWGRNKFLVFYFLSGIGAGLIYLGVHYFEFYQISQKLISFGMSQSEIVSMFTTGSYNQSILSVVSVKELTDIYNLFNVPAVGASGALYGILVAFAFKYPDVELGIMFIPVPIKAKYFVPGIVVLDLILGFSGQSIFGGFGTGIAHFAHVGGAVTGYLLMLYFNKSQFKRWN